MQTGGVAFKFKSDLVSPSIFTISSKTTLIMIWPGVVDRIISCPIALGFILSNNS